MQKRTLAVLFLILLCACTRAPRLPQPPASGLNVIFFDVGQGDAALLRTEDAAVVFDTGRNGEIAGLLRREGVTRIDLLVLSHSHADHTGGLAAVIKAFPVVETWYAGEFKGKVGRALASAGRTERVEAGANKRIGGLTLTVLHAQPNGGGRGRGAESDVNNGSLVVKAVYGESRYLFPGDCELGCWEEMFRAGRRELRADVLKAAHHGSWNGTNSGVLGNVRPSTVVISVGADNRYGHPHPVVLKLLEKLGALVFRTDRQGSIRCRGVQCRAGG
ncbi:MAG TPA: MBL fold metallo-hydrolase [Bryobacteraceae bacterium]|nr:MBL fold metallo-hydrolase [Bryobacteraceae bacterium]